MRNSNYINFQTDIKSNYKQCKNAFSTQLNLHTKVKHLTEEKQCAS